MEKQEAKKYIRSTLRLQIQSTRTSQTSRVQRLSSLVQNTVNIQNLVLHPLLRFLYSIYDDLHVRGSSDPLHTREVQLLSSLCTEASHISSVIEKFSGLLRQFLWFFSMSIVLLECYPKLDDNICSSSNGDPFGG